MFLSNKLPINNALSKKPHSDCITSLGHLGPYPIWGIIYVKNKNVIIYRGYILINLKRICTKYHNIDDDLSKKLLYFFESAYLDNIKPDKNKNKSPA